MLCAHVLISFFPMQRKEREGERERQETEMEILLREPPVVIEEMKGRKKEASYIQTTRDRQKSWRQFLRLKYRHFFHTLFKGTLLSRENNRQVIENKKWEERKCNIVMCPPGSCFLFSAGHSYTSVCRSSSPVFFLFIPGNKVAILMPRVWKKNCRQSWTPCQTGFRSKPLTKKERHDG